MGWSTNCLSPRAARACFFWKRRARPVRGTRGSFETVLADEDVKQDPDRWCSHAPYGQEFWQMVNQWMWNLRLELGQHLSPLPMRTTELAPVSELAPLVEYGPPQWARLSFTHGFSGSAFLPAFGWNASVPCAPSTLCARTPTGTRWLPACVVCCPYR